MKNEKQSLLLFIAIFCTFFSIHTMEIPEFKQEIEVEFPPYEILPIEMNIEIILNILKDNNLNVIIDSIKNLSLIDKKHYQLINDPTTIDIIIKKLQEKEPLEDWYYALLLGIPGATDWLKDQLSKEERSDELRATLNNGFQEIVTLPSFFLTNLKLSTWQANNAKALIKNALKTLLNLDIDINTTNTLGYTPLMIAIERNNFELAQLLLQHPEIDVTRKNVYNKTALDIAKKKGNKRIIYLLKKAEQRKK
ncbi:MAG: ankyrin repeat domain-containing protein [Candidatus Babeliales bacterium]